MFVSILISDFTMQVDVYRLKNRKYRNTQCIILQSNLSLQVGQVTFGHDSIDHLDGAFNRVYDFGPTYGLGRVFPLPMGPN